MTMEFWWGCKDCDFGDANSRENTRCFENILDVEICGFPFASCKLHAGLALVVLTRYSLH